MKKGLFLLLAGVSMVHADVHFEKQADVAQYGGASYANAIHIERGISLEKAFEIAEADEEIAYFVYLKGECMALPTSQQQDLLELITWEQYISDNGSAGEGGCRVFYHGDTVFFTDIGQMWLGTAPGLADTYVAKRSLD